MSNKTKSIGFIILLDQSSSSLQSSKVEIAKITRIGSYGTTSKIVDLIEMKRVELKDALQIILNEVQG